MTPRTLCTVGLGVALTAVFLLADGGTVLFRKSAGRFVITAFGEPVPVRVGAADISAMVQNAGDTGTVLDARVMVRLRQSVEGKIVEIAAPATHDRANNKLLYAAHVTLPSSGRWMLDVDVTGAGGASGSAAGDLDVLPKQPPIKAQWPYFAVVPMLVLFFALNQWLRKRRSIRNPRARP